MRRHPDGRRYALFGLFLAHRERELTDGLIDLLIEIVHKIGSRARNRVLKAFVTEVERVHGKEGLLVRIAEAACLQPERSEEPTSGLQSLMRISYAVFCLKKKKQHT